MEDGRIEEFFVISVKYRNLIERYSTKFVMIFPAREIFVGKINRF